MTWTGKLKGATDTAVAWTRRGAAKAKQVLEDRIEKISEVPDLPEPLREVLRETRTSLLRLVSKVRNREDLKALRAAMVDVVAGAVDALAAGSQADPGEFRSVADVRHFCKESIKWGSGVVEGVALIAGTFAVSAAAHTAGISFGHFFALCAIMGILYSLTVGACEIYAVTSMLVQEHHSDPAREALRLCALPRTSKGSGPSQGADTASDEEGGSHEAKNSEAGAASEEAKFLAATWVKLSVVGSMPVLNDRHMQDRLDALIEILNRRAD